MRPKPADLAIYTLAGAVIGELIVAALAVLGVIP